MGSGLALDPRTMIDWTKRTEALSLKSARLQALRDQKIAEVESRTLEIAELSMTMERLAKTSEALRHLLDLLVTDRVKTLEDLVTEGLRSIFFDQTLAFEAAIGQSRNKVAVDFFIRQGKHSVVKGHPLDSFGGGPATIVSLILRTILLLRLKRYPLLLLDESLVAPSDEYVERIGRFLSKLSTTTGIPILFITQNRSFVEHSDHAYQGTEDVAEDGSWSLGIRRVHK